MLKALHSVLLNVDDFRRSLDFYQNKLGFEVAFVSEQEGGVAGLRLGDVNVLLHSDKVVGPPYLRRDERRGAGLILYFEVDNVDGYHEVLKRTGVEITVPPKDQEYGLRTMYLSDPDGYFLGFAHRIDGNEGRQ